MMKIRLTATGTRPLLMHNGQLSSPLNSYAKAMAKISAKRTKTEDDRLAMARLDFEGSMYFDDGIGPYLPPFSMWRSLMNGAKIIRAGKKVERGVAPTDFMCPLIYNGPRTIEGLWGDGINESDYIDLRPVKVGMSKVDRCRPIFRNWKVECEMTLDTKALEFEEFSEVVALAGLMEGVGDYRQIYGRYESVIEQL